MMMMMMINELYFCNLNIIVQACLVFHVLLWLHRSLKSHQMVNQFPCEEVLTCKDLMLNTARRARVMFPPKSNVENCSAEFPSWLPETYNTVYELPRFVKRFLEQQERYNFHHFVLSIYGIVHNFQ